MRPRSTTIRCRAFLMIQFRWNRNRQVGIRGKEPMLKVIPVEEAVGLPLAHDITEIVPGKHKGPAFRRGHIVRKEDISQLLDVGKRHLYVMELEKDDVHEEDAARRLAKAAAGPNLKLTDPVEGR